MRAVYDLAENGDHGAHRYHSSSNQ
jgi:hypothetical protein